MLETFRNACEAEIEKFSANLRIEERSERLYVPEPLRTMLSGIFDHVRQNEQGGLCNAFAGTGRGVNRQTRPKDLLRQLEEYYRTHTANDFNIER
jgi:hypothetical protein